MEILVNLANTTCHAVIGWITWAHKLGPLIGREEKIISAQSRDFRGMAYSTPGYFYTWFILHLPKIVLFYT